MNKNIYISVDITDYGNGFINCVLLQSIDDGELERTQLDENHANKLMWELVKAGGKRSYRSNYLDPTIVYHGAYLFLPY